MAYVPLDVPGSLPELVVQIIRGPLEGYLRDVHWMLATVIPGGREGPGRQLQLPIALTLLATVAGVSAELYQPPGKASTGARFRDCLTGFYPWDVDPPDGVSNEEAANILYEAYRNPLMHFLGMWHPLTTQLGSVFRGTEDAEERVEKLEGLTVKPYSTPCLVVTDENRALWLDPFYWGIRKMVERWARDTDQVSYASHRLAKRFGTAKG